MAFVPAAAAVGAVVVAGTIGAAVAAAHTDEKRARERRRRAEAQQWQAIVEAGDRERRTAYEAKTITLYHYTTEDGAYGISKSDVIHASSSNNDAAFGKGVYLTSIKPYEHPETILYNNYDDSKSAMKDNWKKVGWVIEIVLPWKEVKKVARHQARGRDIYVYNKDLELSSYKYRIYRNPNY